MFVAKAVWLVLVISGCVLAASGLAIAAELPDYLYSKGGVIYPHSGDSTQEIFRTPPDASEFLKPGMLIGVLPADCTSASHGKLGDIYICHHGLILKPEEKHGGTIYRVVEMD